LRIEKSQSSNGSENVIQEEDYGTFNFKTVDKKKRTERKKKESKQGWGRSLQWAISFDTYQYVV